MKGERAPQVQLRCTIEVRTVESSVSAEAEDEHGARRVRSVEQVAQRLPAGCAAPVWVSVSAT